MNKLYWFEFRDHLTRRKPWRVFLVDALPDSDDEAIGGLCVFADREILIRARLKTSRIKELVAHEMLHAACAHQQRESEADRGGEEHVARQVETSLLQIIKSLGAKIPPLPRGLRAMRKQPA